MKVLVWNCRGVGGPLTIPQLKKMVHLHFPSVGFLDETKNQKSVIEKVQKKIKFDNCWVINPSGKAGRLAMMWKEEVEVMSMDQGTFFIGMKLRDRETDCEWWLVGVYASTDENIRKEQWKTSGEEKWGGRRRHESSFKEFNRFIKENELIDLGFEGKPWTWCNQ
ncbi:uncharacterized protein [Coffea arabica]|uniref:Endonuclease/exonuclease/phosphatase domain-containing protein n=1 Tax=Coffea arabica TaxID=13443 RepID=A0ABM4W8F5_COFAR